MKIHPSLLLALALGSPSSGDESLVRLSEARSPEEELAGLKVPDGFEIRLFAAEPQINKPINIAHDTRGRLWVSSTVEYPYAAEKERWSDVQGTRVRDSRDAIKILEDTDGDGRADKVSDFADGLNIPTGVLPWHKPEHQDGCIAWSIPNIWYFADTTGDGRADHREVLFGPLGYEKDTHGMCSSFRMGPGDGWVYATHGFNNTSILTAKDGTSVKLNSGNVFRFRPDGSSVEVFSRGQVNPFGLTFDRRGNLYSADCHSAPVYQLLQGGIYPSFGKPHDGLGFAPTMIAHHHGSTGICGIAYLDRDWWSGDWNDHLLIGNPVTSRINHDHIVYHGSTPVAIEQADFVTSEDLWFRPVDLCQGSDGALYVADFYNRIIGHYEVPLTHPGRDRERGRIWRITKKDHSPHERVPSKIETVADPIESLGNSDPFTQRQAAHQLQLQPQPDSLEPLLTTLAATPPNDTHLIHVLRMALRNHLEKFPGHIALPSSHSGLLGELAPTVSTAEAATLLASSPAKKNHFRHIARNADDQILTALIAELSSQDSTAENQLAELDEIQAGLDERGFLEPHPGVVAWAQKLATNLLSERAGITDSGWAALPHPDQPESQSPWAAGIRLCQDGVEAEVLSSLSVGQADAEQRTGILQSKEFPAPEKLSFRIVGHRGDPGNEPHLKNHVTLIDARGTELQRAYPPREDIARKVTWDLKAGEPVSIRITDGDSGDAYAWLGITRIEGTDAVSTGTFRMTGDLDARLTRLAEILKLSAPVGLRDRLKPWLPEAPRSVQSTPDGPERERLEAVITQRVSDYENALLDGTLDVAKGAVVFKNNCSSCHQIGHAGGLIGPQLDGIGSRGVERLAEDILDPNRNVDSHFHLTNFTLTDGTLTSYFVTGERGETIQVRDPAGNSRRLQKSQIESSETLPISLMPTTFEETLTGGDFSNLIEWLRHRS